MRRLRSAASLAPGRNGCQRKFRPGDPCESVIPAHEADATGCPLTSQRCPQIAVLPLLTHCKAHQVLVVNGDAEDVILRQRRSCQTKNNLMRWAIATTLASFAATCCYAGQEAVEMPSPRVTKYLVGFAKSLWSARQAARFSNLRGNPCPLNVLNSTSGLRLRLMSPQKCTS